MKFGEKVFHTYDWNIHLFVLYDIIEESEQNDREKINVLLSDGLLSLLAEIREVDMQSLLCFSC